MKGNWDRSVFVLGEWNLGLWEWDNIIYFRGSRNVEKMFQRLSIGFITKVQLHFNAVYQVVLALQFTWFFA